ncbi:MAG: methyl-accepting chemotaxis protein [Defluviitaleaceae bacterium]|nr:methyl-accepting chemotaxis protein [Defluviitaleaceae bacterium]
MKNFLSLRSKILVPVLTLMIAVVAAITVTSYISTRATIVGLIDAEMDAAISNILAADRLDEINQIVLDELDSKNLALARAFTEIIRLNPSLVAGDGMASLAEMQRIADALGVSEVHVADENGILRWGNVPGFFGFDYNSGEQSRPFMQMLTDPTFELAQEAQPNEATGAMFAYAGVARTDARGFVQVGIDAYVLDNLNEALSVQRTIAETMLGATGYLFIVTDGIITAHPNSGMVGQNFAPQNQRSVGDNRQWLTINNEVFYVGFFTIGNETIYAVIPEAEFDASTSIMSVMGAASIAVVLISLLAMSIVLIALIRSITAPITKLSAAAEQISVGDLAVNFDSSRGDEIGQLARSFASVQGVINTMIADLSNAHSQYIDAGDIHYNIDENKYQNSFKDVIGQVNKILSNVTADIEDLVVAMDGINDGDFNKQLDPNVWVGGWAFVPRALNNLSDGLKSVSAEINNITHAVSKGDLSVQIDTVSYKGDWGVIMTGLNSIAKAIHDPIKVIEMAAHEMREGNFDLQYIDEKIAQTGINPSPDNYGGIFKDVIRTFDLSIAETSSYITELKQVLAQMAEGDLRNKINRNYVGSFDIIKNSVNTINEKLHSTMSEILTASDQVLAGANQISLSAASLSEGAREQSSSVQELNAQVEMIGTQTRQNAENATAANELSGKSTMNAKEGSSAMVQMVDAMNQIKESSSNIGQIVKTVQDIAFQTNLLALNASVEAARAGEHGKGFAVVADEVRTLAGRSQEAATQTTELIQDSIIRVDAGGHIAESTAISLDAIVASANEVLEVIGSISAASKEQSEAIEQISGGINKISNVTQTNTAVSEETAAASQELNAQAETLRELVGFFKL